MTLWLASLAALLSLALASTIVAEVSRQRRERRIEALVARLVMDRWAR